MMDVSCSGNMSIYTAGMRQPLWIAGRHER